MQKIFNLIMGIIILFGTFSAIFYPKTLDLITYKINNSNSNYYHLSFVDNSNIKFELKLDCQYFSDQYTSILELIGGPAFKIDVNSKFIKIDIGHEFKNEIETIYFKRKNFKFENNCHDTLIYDSQINILEFNNNQTNSYQVQKLNLNSVINFNRVIKLNSFKQPYLTSLNIEKLNFQSNNITFWTYGILLVSIAFFFFQFYQKNLISFDYSPNIKIILEIIIFVVIIFLISLVELPRGDDGWYLIIQKFFNLTNIYDNYVFSTPRPSGYIINFISAHLSDFEIMFLLRFLPLIFFILCVLISIKIFNLFPNILYLKNKYFYWSLLFIFLASFNSLRPEVYIACLYILIIFILLKINFKNYFKFMSLIIVIIGFGISIHQQAVILIFSSFSLVLQYMLYKPKLKLKDFLFVALSFSISIQFILIQGNIFWFKNAIDTFTRTANNASPGIFLNNYPLYAEWIRPYHLYFSGLSTQSQIFLGTLLFIVSIFLIYTSFKLFKIESMKYSGIHFLTISLSLAPFGLFLSPIKWSWYYAPLFLNIIFAYFILNFTKIYQKNLKIVLAQILTIGFSASLAFTYDWRANDFNWPLRYVTSSELNSKYWLIFGSSKSAIMWIVLTIIALVLVYYLKNNSFEIQLKVLNVFTIFIILTLSVIHLSPPVIDAIKNPHEWTFVKQSVVGIWDKKARCGLASTIKDQETGKPIQQLLNENNWTVVSMPAPYIFIPCANPVLTEAGSWLMPDVSFGWVPVYDQQRLATETDIKLMGCDESLQTEDAAQKCFYKWDTKIKNLPPYTTKVVYYPDYGQILEKINPFK